MKRSWLMTGAVVATMASVAVSAAWLWRPAKGRADVADHDQVSLGAEVYRSHCAACHGKSLEGQPDWQTRKPDGRLPAPPHDKTGHTWHHPDSILFSITKLGMKPPVAPDGYESDMPNFSTVLTDEEIWAVLAYIKSTWPPQIQARHQRLSSAQQQ